MIKPQLELAIAITMIKYISSWVFEVQGLAELSLLIPGFKGGDDLCLFILPERSAQVSRILLIVELDK